MIPHNRAAMGKRAHMVAQMTGQEGRKLHQEGLKGDEDRAEIQEEKKRQQ